MFNEQLAPQTNHIDHALLQRILAPYSPTGTDYLKSTELLHSWRSASHNEDDPFITSTGAFSIPNSCYIQATGHFNAVEFIICYNQLAYATFGQLFDGEFFKDAGFGDICPGSTGEAIANISIDTFFRDQLASMLILKTTTKFRGMIDAKNFYGTFSINKFKARGNTLFCETTCVFRDNNKGYAEGDVLLAYQPKAD